MDMDREIERLKKEILVLNARIKTLEGKEHRRSIFKSIKFLFSIAIIGLVAFGIWKGYDYITNYIPNYLDEQIQELNPFSDISNNKNGLNSEM